MSQYINNYEEIIEYLIKKIKLLTLKEAAFLTAVRRKYARDKWLTNYQMKKLIEIHEKHRKELIQKMGDDENI